MKYLVRSIKYFFYFAFLTALILYALAFLGMADSNIANNFAGGYNDFWKIGLFFAAVAAVYPKLGFINRKLYIEPSSEIQAEIILFFQDRRYVLESQTSDRCYDHRDHLLIFYLENRCEGGRFLCNSWQTGSI